MPRKFTDNEVDELERQANRAIHEIVFACHHVGEEDYESAANALLTAQDLLDRVAEKVAAECES